MLRINLHIKFNFTSLFFYTNVNSKKWKLILDKYCILNFTGHTLAHCKVGLGPLVKSSETSNSVVLYEMNTKRNAVIH